MGTTNDCDCWRCLTMACLMIVVFLQLLTVRQAVLSLGRARQTHTVQAPKPRKAAAAVATT